MKITMKKELITLLILISRNGTSRPHFYKAIQDFVARSDIGDELQKSHGIGKKRAESIDNTVKKIIEEFLT